MIGRQDVERLIADGRKQARRWERFDILLTPAMPQIPPRIAELTPSKEHPLGNFARQLTIAVYTSPLTGHPAVSMPAGRSASGLPIEVQVATDQYMEGSLILLAAQLEQPRPSPTVATERFGRR
jgi:amidase